MSRMLNYIYDDSGGVCIVLYFIFAVRKYRIDYQETSARCNVALTLPWICVWFSSPQCFSFSFWAVAPGDTFCDILILPLPSYIVLILVRNTP